MQYKKTLSKKFLIGTGMFIATAGIVGSVMSANAYKGDPNVKGPNYTSERHDAMVRAFEDNDYDAWRALMGEGRRVTQVINEKNFPQLVEAHNLALQGKIEEANKIRAELGLGLRNGQGQGRGMGRGMHGNR